MNKTLIVTAVSAALMAPVAAQADVTLYGRIHNGIKFVDSDKAGAKSTTDFVSVGSRFGIKASSDLGNGLTASAHYEFTTSTDTPGTGVVNTRIGTVGLSGAFGSVTAGNQWGAYYNTAGVHFDPTFSVGGTTYYIDDGGPLRTPNTIKYSNSFGPVHFELDSRIDDSDEGTDGFAAGISVAVNDMITIAAAIDDGEKGGVDRTQTALAVQVSLGNYWASIGHHSVDPNGDGPDPSTTQFWIGGSWGNTSAMLGTGQGDYDKKGNPAGNDLSDITLGIYHNMGGGFKLLYEGNSNDVDNDPAKSDSTTHLFGVRLDF